MQPSIEARTRRHFLTTAASGLGTLALASMLRAEEPARRADPLAPRKPHYRPRAERCIFLFQAGAPSQLDLFDPKPRLNELHGQPLPKSMTDQVRFAFIQKESAVLMGTKRKFRQHGSCGMELSDLLPHLSRHVDDIALIRSMQTDAFNHHPGQLMMQTGHSLFGRPSIGSWLTYGLGSLADNLPGYVVLNAGRGASAGSSNWTSGFLSSTYQGVLLRGQGDPILHLRNPAGIDCDVQRASLDLARDLNRERHALSLDPEIEARTASYELAFRMQAAAPELLDLSGEDPRTLREYGVDRDDTGRKGGRGKAGNGTFARYARSCLLARRLIERGVRFVNLIHASWDHHSNLDVELEYNAEMADQPVAALLTDLERRGLLDTTLVVWAGEFGRTPLGENRRGRAPNTGRDHHPFAFSVWMAGGGVRGGQVLGATDDIGWNVVERPVHVHDLQATLLHLFGLDHERLTFRHQGRDHRLTDVAGSVVGELVA